MSEYDLVTCGTYRHGAIDGLIHVRTPNCSNPVPVAPPSPEPATRTAVEEWREWFRANCEDPAAPDPVLAPCVKCGTMVHPDNTHAHCAPAPAQGPSSEPATGMERTPLVPVGSRWVTNPAPAPGPVAGERCRCGQHRSSPVHATTFDSLIGPTHAFAPAPGPESAPIPGMTPMPVVVDDGKCLRCRGTGEEDQMGIWMKCHKCNGTGKRPAPGPERCGCGCHRGTGSTCCEGCA